MSKQSNPFIYGDPVPFSHFIGRDREVDTIMSRLVSPGNGDCAVSGEAQIGKTSLLRYIASPPVLRRWGLEPSQDVFLKIDGQILSPFSPLLFWRTVLDNIQQKVKETDLRSKIEAAHRKKDIAGPDLIALFENITESKKLIILLDEFEWVVANIDPHQPDFFNTLRALIQLPRLALVTATRAPLETLTSQISFVDTRFPKAFAPIELGPFSREEAKELIDRALQGTGVTFSEDDRKFVYEVSKGHPYWLQNACFKLFQRYTSHGAT